MNYNLPKQEARNCVKKQLLWCLDGLEELLNANKSYVDTSGSFIKWMDAALEQLTHIDLTKSIHECINNFQKSKHTTEEVLCHAMSIAQIALIQDSKIIKGSSQAVQLQNSSRLIQNYTTLFF